MSLPFYYQDPIAEADPISRAVVRLTLEYQIPGQIESEIQTLATGTGIINRSLDNRFFLVTAWHNLSGKSLEGKTLHSQAALPNWVGIHGFWFKHRFRLFDGDNNPNSCSPLYKTHSKNNQIDVTILPLPGISKCNCLFQLSEGTLQTHVSDSVYVVGFPLGLVNQVDDNTPLPIWKIGNIANDPGPDFEGVPRFLIDATTLPGMSGSPVILRRKFTGYVNQFLGIYVGRYVIPVKNNVIDQPIAFGNEPDRGSSALGWVIKSSILDDIFSLF